MRRDHAEVGNVIVRVEIIRVLVVGERVVENGALRTAVDAELAGLSLCWYTLFESASPKHRCSPRAVDRVADALQLTPENRALHWRDRRRIRCAVKRPVCRGSLGLKERK